MFHFTHMNEFARIMSHIWMSHVTPMNECCYKYEWVMSHIWMSHVTHMNESCHTYPSDMSSRARIESRQSHRTHTTQSCHTHKHELRQHTHVNKSCHTHKNKAVHTHTLVLLSLHRVETVRVSKAIAVSLRTPASYFFGFLIAEEDIKKIKERDTKTKGGGGWKNCENLLGCCI